MAMRPDLFNPVNRFVITLLAALVPALSSCAESATVIPAPAVDAPAAARRLCRVPRPHPGSVASGQHVVCRIVSIVRLILRAALLQLQQPVERPMEMDQSRFISAEDDRLLRT